MNDTLKRALIPILELYFTLVTVGFVAPLIGYYLLPRTLFSSPAKNAAVMVLVAFGPCLAYNVILVLKRFGWVQRAHRYLFVPPLFYFLAFTFVWIPMLLGGHQVLLQGPTVTTLIWLAYVPVALILFLFHGHKLKNAR